MAEEKLSQRVQNPNPLTGTEIFHVVTNPSTTPASWRDTLTRVRDWIVAYLLGTANTWTQKQTFSGSIQLPLTDGFLGVDVNGDVEIRQPSLYVSGKTIYIDPLSPSATDTRTGISKYSFSQPFATLQAAVNASASGDYLYCAGVVQTAVVTSKSLFFYLDFNSEVSLDFSNTISSITNFISGDGKLTQLRILTGNGIFIRCRNLREVTAFVNNNGGGNIDWSFENVKTIGSISGTGLILKGNFFNCEVIPAITWAGGGGIQISITNSITVGNINATSSTALQDIQLVNIKQCGQVLSSTRSGNQKVYARNVRFFTNAIPCIRFSDLASGNFTLVNCILRSNNPAGAISFNSTIGGSTAFTTTMNTLADAGFQVTGTTSRVIDLENNFVTSTTAILDKTI